MKVKNVLCRKRTNIALKMTFTGLFAVAAALYFLGATPAYAQNGPPLNPGDAPGGLPQCQDELAMCEEELIQSTADLDTCTQGLADCEALSSVFPGDGVDGPPLAYEDNGDGTFSDLNTGLMWEMKVAGGDGTCNLANLHLVNSRCTWDQFTGAWIDAINVEALGGFTDWRPANVKELQSIVDYSINVPASSVPGETAASFYWSSTTFADDPFSAWVVSFFFGGVGGVNKDFLSSHVRAVRGGR